MYSGTAVPVAQPAAKTSVAKRLARDSMRLSFMLLCLDLSSLAGSESRFGDAVAVLNAPQLG